MTQPTQILLERGLPAKAVFQVCEILLTTLAPSRASLAPTVFIVN